MIFIVFYGFLACFVHGYRSNDGIWFNWPSLPSWSSIKSDTIDALDPFSITRKLIPYSQYTDTLNVLTMKIESIEVVIPYAYNVYNEVFTWPEYKVGVSSHKLADDQRYIAPFFSQSIFQEFSMMSEAYWTEEVDSAIQTTSFIATSAHLKDKNISYGSDTVGELKEMALPFNLRDILENQRTPETTIYVHIKEDDIMFDDWILDNLPITDFIIKDLFLKELKLSSLEELKGGLEKEKITTASGKKTELKVPFNVAYLTNTTYQKELMKTLIDKPASGSIVFKLSEWSWKTSNNTATKKTTKATTS